MEGETDPRPVTLPAGRYTALISGAVRICALTEAGEVVCRGDTAYESAPFFDPHGVEW